MNASNWLWHDHRDYEDLLRACASVAAAAEWAAAEERLQDLVSLLKGHFQVEEEVLFPAFEELVDVQGAPTRTLRGEHNLIRDLLAELADQMGVDPEGYYKLIRFVTDRPGHDRRYAMDYSKAALELDWRPEVDLGEGLHRTVSWYLAKKSWWAEVKSGAYREYYARMYDGR